MTMEIESYPASAPMMATTAAQEEVEQDHLWNEASNEDKDGKLVDLKDDADDDEEQEESDDGLPSETQLVLLCLDYLRDLRRSYPIDADLEEAEGLHGKYLSLAIYALSRCFLRPVYMQSENDAWGTHPHSSNPSSFEIPSLETIQQEIYNENDEYNYDDSHISNSLRFYPLNGLASGPALLGGPLTLAALANAGLTNLGARSRQEADREVTQSHLFEQFVAAVQAKGFFNDVENSQPKSDPEEEKIRQMRQEEVYNDRFGKVVSKFRTKLATKAAAAQQQQQSRLAGATSPTSIGSNGKRNYFDQSTTTENLQMAMASLDRQRQRREKRAADLRIHRERKHGDASQNSAGTPKLSNKLMLHSTDTTRGTTAATTAKNTSLVAPKAVPTTPDSAMLSVLNPGNFDTLSVCNNAENPLDLEEAERLKTRGNMHMQKKEYELAAAAYTQALKLSPAGPHSHVYFSNRAAALLSLKRFSEAVLDSERSLALKPDYGKAHARLGLAHYILGNYKAARDAYANSLNYEPDNKSSRSYLEKSIKHLAIQEQRDIENEHTNGHHENNLPSSPDTTDRISSPMGSEPAAVPPPSEAKYAATVTTAITTAVEEDQTKQLIVQEREAEQYKIRGNSCMAGRDYHAAVEAYTTAIQLSPNGPESHVFYSNRAAAYCYLERYNDAEWDSLQSLELNPSYGKAHARLGLSRFFQGDYKGAVEAYTAALHYDPDNAASKSYLLKAQARMERQEQPAQARSAAKSSNALGSTANGGEHGPFPPQGVSQSAEI